MKQVNITILALASLFITSCSNAEKAKENETTHDSVATATPEVTREKPPLDSAANAQAMQAYMTPGDMHKWLSSTDGKWEADMTFWMDADAKAIPGGNCTVENKMILGGRYQQSIYKGNMMGMAYEGHGTMAYDNAKKKFINTWVDNSGTGLMYMEGTYDEGTKTINFSGKMIDPATGNEGEMRQALKTIDDKNQLLEMYTLKDGKEFKSMEIKLARK